MKKTGIFIEVSNGKINNANFGMITAARTDGRQLYAFIINSCAEKSAKKLKNYGIHKIVNISYPPDSRGKWDPISWCEAILKAMHTFEINILLGLSTGMGRELLPRMAAELDAPLVMDCIDINFNENTADTFKYSGKTIAKVKVTGEHLFFGIKPNIIDAVPAKKNISETDKMEILSFPVEINSLETTNQSGNAGNMSNTGNSDNPVNTGNTSNADSTGNIKLIETKLPANSNLDNFSSVSLMEADVIISGGRGMKNRENFRILAECAEQMGAAVGASRVAVDSGWVPYAMQVGQTGEKVSPRVYIACGIAGSVQHFAGMKTSNMIIAINIDLSASIISLCDYYIVMDLFDIVPLLTKLLGEIQK